MKIIYNLKFVCCSENKMAFNSIDDKNGHSLHAIWEMFII
jgi:hypothetical protein